MFDILSKAAETIQTAIDWRPYLPERLKLAWIVALFLGCAVLAVLVGWSAYHRFFDPARHLVERKLQLESRIADYRERNFQLEWKTGDAALLTLPFTRDDHSNLLMETKVLAFADHAVTFTVMVPFEDAFWRASSIKYFERDNGTLVSLPNLFRTREYQLALKTPDHMVCVGLASRNTKEGSETNARDNESLALARADRLCGIAAAALGQNTPMSYWIMPLGYSIRDGIEPGSITERRQRSAVIIGVKGADAEELQRELPRVLLSMKLSNVDLSQYSGSQSPQIERFEVDWDSEVDFEEDDAFKGVE